MMTIPMTMKQTNNYSFSHRVKITILFILGLVFAISAGVAAIINSNLNGISKVKKERVSSGNR